MTLNISFSKTNPAKTDTLVFCCIGQSLSKDHLSIFKKESAALVRRALSKSPKFKGKCGDMVSVPLPEKEKAARVVLFSLGADNKNVTVQDIEQAGAKLYAGLRALGVQEAYILTPDLKKAGISANHANAHLAIGAQLRAYQFNKFKAKDKNATRIKKLTFSGQKTIHYQNMAAQIAGVMFTRDLVNEPPNTLYPDSYAKILKKELTPLGIKVDILDDKQMRAKGFHAHWEVGKGSARLPRVVIMRWNGAPKSAKGKKQPFALVGKGVTFDTGGISLKPGAGMDEMKMDMGGSATVAGVMKTLALQKAKTNVVGIVGLAENMPSAKAYRPGDIINSMAGKTIEVLNTDAEGRLVLVDALTYVQKKYKPRAVIDLATLTGAMMVALGFEYAGAFVNDDTLWQNLYKSAAHNGEKIWRMPLDESYREEVVSHVADLKNLGAHRQYGGACTAAAFLEHFIHEDTVWAHIDIAGTAWGKGPRTLGPRGGTGYGVRLLSDLITTYYK